jgi:hypothetical protein
MSGGRVLDDLGGTSVTVHDDAERRRWLDERAARAGQVERVAAAVRAAVAEGRTFDPAWPDAVTDLLATLERICQFDNHPDDVDRAQRAIVTLAGLWMTVEQVEEIYLGGERS